MTKLVRPRPIACARLAYVLAVFALLVAAISSALLWLGLVTTIPGLAALISSLGVALFAIVFALVAFVLIWRTGCAGASRAASGFVLAVLLIAPALGFAGYALRLPPITDVSTDTIDPPQFAVALEDRPPDANHIHYDERGAGLQIASYPSLRSFVVDLPPEEAYAKVLRLVHERGWRLLSAIPPTGRRSTGQIEAVAPSLLPGLEDDVVIRIRGQNDRARLDMRSASRYGPVDAGINAWRITSFFADLETLLLSANQAGE